MVLLVMVGGGVGLRPDWDLNSYKQIETEEQSYLFGLLKISCSTQQYLQLTQVIELERERFFNLI